MGMIKTRVTSREEAKKIKGLTKEKKARASTEEAIHKAALSDPDAQPLTEYELALFRPFVFLKNRLKL